MQQGVVRVRRHAAGRADLARRLADLRSESEELLLAEEDLRVEAPLEDISGMARVVDRRQGAVSRIRLLLRGCRTRRRRAVVALARWDVRGVARGCERVLGDGRSRRRDCGGLARIVSALGGLRCVTIVVGLLLFFLFFFFLNYLPKPQLHTTLRSPLILSSCCGFSLRRSPMLRHYLVLLQIPTAPQPYAAPLPSSAAASHCAAVLCCAFTVHCPTASLFLAHHTCI